MKKLAIGIFILLTSTFSFAENIELEKKDYLTLLVMNYVHGFKEFDTSVVSLEGAVSIGIYYDTSTQAEARANQLALRFRSQLPVKLNQYQWAKNVKVIVNVYSENRTGGGY
jgi:hypothetical protein